jgi:hypothetical protein
MASSSVEIEIAEETEKNDPSVTEEKEILVEPKEEVYQKLKSKIEILDMLFHPTENNLISIGLMNGKLRM